MEKILEKLKIKNKEELIKLMKQFIKYTKDDYYAITFTITASEPCKR